MSSLNERPQYGVEGTPWIVAVQEKRFSPFGNADIPTGGDLRRLISSFCSLNWQILEIHPGCPCSNLSVPFCSYFRSSLHFRCTPLYLQKAAARGWILDTRSGVAD